MRGSVSCLPLAMEKKAKPDIPDAFLWLKDLPEKTAPERFTAEQMIVCDACKRKNAPTKLACLYCGATLKISEDAAIFVRPTLRKLENWEKGWNIIVLPEGSADLADETLAQSADFVRIGREELKKIIAANQPLPLARAESVEEAELIEKHLEGSGIKTRTISDAVLQTDALPSRVRGLEFGGSYVNLHLLGKDEIVCMFYAEIELLVVGTIVERQVDNRERRKGEDRFEIKDSTETSTDESVLDFYTMGERAGYRISARNFDFSCLGEEKKLLASENFKILLEKLKEKSHNARFDDSYRRVRQVLNTVWQPEERSESMGLQREGIGKFNMENRLTVSNAAQFLRYSRLLRELKTK
jgi:hypothetical protein